MDTSLKIPKSEFLDRIARFQARIQSAGLDACLVHGNESDMANVRYLTEQWPTFEAAAVFVPAVGTPVLITGPESGKYGLGRNALPTVKSMLTYREMAEPDYPGMKLDTYADVVKAAMGDRPLKKLGICSWAITPLPVWFALKEQLPEVEIVKADETLLPLRYVKSANELACFREAFRIAETAVDAILGEIKPGMTEFQVIGIAQREIYKNGGEYEGHALYCFCGERTNNAICRPSHNILKEHQLIQLNIGARVDGYSSSIGIPLSFGALPAEQEKLVKFGLEAHLHSIAQTGIGKNVGELVRAYEQWVRDRGYGDYLVYGPFHSIGMMEVERPWMESTSDYTLEANMTFQADTFFSGKDFGLRWEKGIVIRPDGTEVLGGKFNQPVVL